MQRKWKHSLAGVALLLALGASPATANDFNVGGGNVAALIQAINDANDEAANPGADTIILDGSTFTLTEINNNTLGNNGLPVITSEIIIEGNGGTIHRSSAGGTPAFRIIAINGSGDLTLNETTISGGLANAGGFYGSAGGGIFNFGTATMTNNTISENTADAGGGIYNGGGTATFINSTISGNTVDNSGGGIFNRGAVEIINSTISGNDSGNYGGGIYNDDTSDIQNTIVSGNTAEGPGDNCFDSGTINDNGSNLSNDATCGFSGDNNNSINLGPLADNGGHTLTHALVSGSSAIDAGNDAVCNASPVNGADQRGISRPQLSSCDIGAFEFIDQNNNNIDDCVDTNFFADIDGDGVSDFCDALIGDITPAPTLSQWGMIAFGFIAGMFGLGFLRRKKGLVVRG
ncbi:MAG: IPTL-CTERM sorting domain-containing protein [Thermodesulfobacteriota bacterium]